MLDLINLFTVSDFQLHTLDLTNYIFVTDESMQYIGQMGR